jgi:hypothetical protein
VILNQSRGSQALLVVIGGWVVVRVLVLTFAISDPHAAMPGRVANAPSALPRGRSDSALPNAQWRALATEARRTGLLPSEPSLRETSVDRWSLTMHGTSADTAQPPTIPTAPVPSDTTRNMVVMLGSAPSTPITEPTHLALPAVLTPDGAMTVTPVSNRWSLDVFAFFRGGRLTGAVPSSSGQGAGILGGTQHAAILHYRIDHQARLDAFVRLTGVGDPPRGEAIAAGIAVQPLRALPLRVIAERRQRLSTAGRSATALYVAGGGRVQAGRWQVDGYGASGVVGARRRQAFAEGSARATTPVLRVGSFDLAAGAGSWAAAQRGAARFDVGPILIMQPRGPAAPTLALDWRIRVAGDARPARGAALTVSMNF